MGNAQQAFVEDMRGLGLHPRVEAELIVCEVIPAVGARAGASLALGVSVEELSNWPHAPRIGFTYLRRSRSAQRTARRHRSQAG